MYGGILNGGEMQYGNTTSSNCCFNSLLGQQAETTNIQPNKKPTEEKCQKKKN